jgi:hypothetical protein
MKRMRMVGLAALAVLALSAVESAAASAAPPEFGRCVKAVGRTGQYTGPACLALAAGGKGLYNWFPAPGPSPKFSGTGEGTALETEGNKRRIECGGSTFNGEYTGPKTEKVTVDLIGCTETKSKLPCESNPANEGEIETPQPLEGELGFIKTGTSPVVGLDLKHEPVLVAFECAKLGELSKLHGTIEGSVIAPIKRINIMVSEFTMAYKSTAGKQAVQSFEGKPKDTLTTKFLVETTPVTEVTALKGLVTEENVEPLEIKAR